MNRNDTTTLDRLLEGDRFYKQGTKEKIAMAVQQITSTRHGTVDTVTICPSEHYKKDRNERWHKLVARPQEYGVVFLRHEIDTI